MLTPYKIDPLERFQKGWVMSGERTVGDDTEGQRQVQSLLNVQGFSKWGESLCWNTYGDALSYDIKGNQKVYEGKVTKRCILSLVNSIYDPLGLLAPFTVKAKILMRKIWGLYPKIDWDDELPINITAEWADICTEVKEIQQLKFRRSLTPDHAIGSPILIIFSDGSTKAYGTVAYCRRETKTGFECRIILAKSRIAPLKVISIVRLELWAAILSKRIRTFIERERNLTFSKTYHFIDSEIVKGMIGKESYGYNTFEANRVGEIQQETKAEE